jgi:hypothetical protein
MYYRTAFRFNYEAYISSQYNYVIYKPNNWNITTSTTESSSITRFDSPEIDDKNPLASVGVATLLNTPKNNDSDSAKNSLFQRYARAVATPYDDYEEVKREEITIDDLPALYINAQGSIDGRTDMLEYYVIYNQRGNSYVLSFNRYSAKKDDFEKTLYRYGIHSTLTPTLRILVNTLKYHLCRRLYCSINLLQLKIQMRFVNGRH